MLQSKGGRISLEAISTPEKINEELKRVSKLPFDRPPVPWYIRLIKWIIKLLK